jgi:hypothetical protein
MPFTAAWLEVNFGGAYAGLATVGYRLVNDTGGDSVARTTTGVVDFGGGAYGVAAVTVPDSAVSIQWDTGGGSPVYATEDLADNRIPGAVWEELAADHVAAGSFGRWLNLLRYRGEVWIDANSGNTNTVLGTDGTPENPVSTLAAALTIAGNLGVQSLAVTNQSFLTLTAGLAKWKIRGVGGGNILILNGQDINTAEVLNMVVTGDQVGGIIFFRDCIVTGVNDLAGIFRHCQFQIGCTLSSIDSYTFEQCTFGAFQFPFTLTWPAGSTQATFGDCSGNLIFASMNNLQYAEYQGRGALEIDATCTDATVRIRGPVDVTDNGTTSNLELDTALTRSGIDDELTAAHGAGAWTETIPAAIADAVWDELIAGHLGGDKAGQRLMDAAATADPAVIADAVWDELKTDHTIAGSFGQILAPPFKYVSIETEIKTTTIETEIRPPIQIDTEIDCK